jgi:hypothetical protein
MKELIASAVIILILFVVCIILIVRNNHLKTSVNEATISMNKLKSSSPGFGKLGSDSNNNILDLSKLESVNLNKSADGKYFILNSGKPAYFPNGIKIKCDPSVDKVDNNALQDHIKQNSTTFDKDGKVISHGILPWKDFQYNLKQYSSQNPVPSTLLESLKHYTGLISQFLSNNKSASSEWNDVLDYFKTLLQPTPGEKPIPPPMPSINEILDWMKYSVIKVGGISAILHRFQKHIKYSILKEVQTHSLDVAVEKSVAQEVGTGKCTMYPLSWYQSCPAGSVQSGSRGWGNGFACNKWYEHLSGEMLCKTKPTEVTIEVDTDKLCEFTKDLNKYHGKIAKTVTEILSLLQLIPSIASVILTINSILFLSIQIAGDFTWLMNDIDDVCNNFKCDNSCKGKKCVPRDTDEVLINRDCLTSPDCNLSDAGSCTASSETTTSLFARMSPNKNNSSIKWSQLV